MLINVRVNNEIFGDLQKHESYLQRMIMTAGMTALAPFMNGLSLAALPFITQYTNKVREKNVVPLEINFVWKI